MTLSNVRLIFFREIRDQLRDRRTLFMVAVLPLLLYPLLGMSLFQVSQFVQEKPTRVLVVGAKNVTEVPPLFENQQFAKELFFDPSRSNLLELQFAPDAPQTHGDAIVDPRAEADSQVRAGAYEAALYFPPNFAAQLDSFRKAVSGKTSHERLRLKVPSPEIIYSTANEKSQIAFARLSDVLQRWMEQIGDDNLIKSGVPSVAIRPFSVESADVADASHRKASMWSKCLPVLLLIWVLTGAFYPAVDLCAGEKERGTLETLLCSPAQRSEIAVGKLLTIMLFSIVTALLNLLSVALTGWMVIAQLPGFGLPSPMAIAVMVLALGPISALFGALCLALAAFARSTKEGQYYLVPLLMIVMPLVILPMSPGVELNLGNSLIPISGMVLVLRCVLEGNYWQALQFSPGVVAVTLVACFLSIRWAIDQFNSESVLFRESERLDIGLWIRHVLRDRQPTPTAAAALACGVIILVANFFLGLSSKMPEGFGGFTRVALVTQLAVIAAPALLMAFFLTSSPRQTLLLRWPRWLTIPAAALLAVALHPAVNLLRSAVQELYPVAENVKPALEKMLGLFNNASFWPLVLVIAIVPAVCEELAFRGFILSGFRRLGHKWRAIVFSALLFGLAHGVLQQSLIACLLGAVLGFLAVQSGSILPGMVFHAVNNTLALAGSRVTPAMIPDSPLLRQFIAPADGGGFVFEWRLVLVASLSAVLLLAWFGRLNCSKSPEERMTEAIERGK